MLPLPIRSAPTTAPWTATKGGWSGLWGCLSVVKTGFLLFQREALVSASWCLHAPSILLTSCPGRLTPLCETPREEQPQSWARKKQASGGGSGVLRESNVALGVFVCGSEEAATGRSEGPSWFSVLVSLCLSLDASLFLNFVF